MKIFLGSLDFLAVTPAIARQAGLLWRDCRQKGQTLSYRDVTIAAVALSYRAPFWPITVSISGRGFGIVPLPAC